MPNKPNIFIACVHKCHQSQCLISYFGFSLMIIFSSCGHETLLKCKKKKNKFYLEFLHLIHAESLDWISLDTLRVCLWLYALAGHAY